MRGVPDSDERLQSRFTRPGPDTHLLGTPTKSTMEGTLRSVPLEPFNDTFYDRTVLGASTVDPCRVYDLPSRRESV